MEKEAELKTNTIADPEGDQATFEKEFAEAPDEQLQLPLTEKPEVPAVVVKPAVTDPPVDYKDLYEKEKQRTSSWEGRITKAEAKAAELEAKLKSPETVKPQEPPVTQPTVDADDPVVKAFLEEMGDDFIKPLEAWLKKRDKVTIDVALKPYMDKLSKLDLLDKLPELEQRIVSADEDKVNIHIKAILAAHSDVPVLMESGEIDQYIETLPYKQALNGKRIMDKGTTQEIIDFLTEFKAATGKINSPKGNGGATSEEPKPPVVSKEKLNAATAVKGTSYAIPKGRADANDFVGAFDEAVALDSLAK